MRGPESAGMACHKPVARASHTLEVGGILQNRKISMEMKGKYSECFNGVVCAHTCVSVCMCVCKIERGRERE